MRSVRPELAVFGYLALVFVGGALLAPPLYWLAQSALPADSMLATQPFHRYVNRCLMVLALGGLWPLLRLAGLRTRADLGFGWDARWASRIGWGAALGVGTLAVYTGCALLLGGRLKGPALTGEVLLAKLGVALGSTVTVSLLEEILFRGALFGALRRAWPWLPALLVASVIFAALHLLESVRFHGEVRWSSGFTVLGEMSAKLTDARLVFPALLNYAVVGACLGLAWQLSGTLYFSIGLHAGWVFGMLTTNLLTQPMDFHHSPFWGTNRIVDGWFVFGLMIAALLVVARWRPAREPAIAPHGSP